MSSPLSSNHVATDPFLCTSCKDSKVVEIFHGAFRILAGVPSWPVVLFTSRDSSTLHAHIKHGKLLFPRLIRSATSIPVGNCRSLKAAFSQLQKSSFSRGLCGQELSEDYFHFDMLRTNSYGIVHFSHEGFYINFQRHLRSKFE